MDSTDVSLPADFVAFYRGNLASTVRSIALVVGDAAEDVAQEAFMTALADWDRVGGLESPAGWVRFVARRMALRRRYREQNRPRFEATAGSTAVTTQDATVDVDLEAAMCLLPERQRAAVELYYLADLPVSEVARTLDVTEAAVKVWLLRARENLGVQLGGHGGTWVSERRWSPDQLVVRMRETNDSAFTEIVIDELGSRDHRWVFRLQDGRYEIGSGEPELLDRGRYRARGRSLVLTPWDESGVVVLGLSTDAGRARFRLIDDTTAPTRGVPDDVYLRLLLEADIFVWTGHGRRPSHL